VTPSNESFISLDLLDRCHIHKKKGKEWAKRNGGYFQGGNAVEASTLGPDAGHGLIACVSYQPGDYITWYEGELRCCKPSKVTKAENDYAVQWEKNRSSLIGLWHENLKPGRGLGSLANDRNLGKVEGPCKKNNARFSLPDKDSKCCWLIALQLIERWEEITVTYGSGYRL
jgi:hypothetical protein